MKKNNSTLRWVKKGIKVFQQGPGIKNQRESLFLGGPRPGPGELGKV